MTPRDIEDPPENHSLGKGVLASAADGFEHVGDALARALDSIARGIDPTLEQIEAAAMSEIAKILGWPLDHAAWSDPENLPDDPDPDPFALPGAATSPEELERRLAAIAEMTPPTDPKAVEIYTVYAEAGPQAARQAIVDAYARGEIGRNQANVLFFVLGLGRL
ncbi:hypothetical protein [Inquilinus limosus]|uniref:Uncharacterized protein n=1 Tax=Inquilinus limosus TaxID=171674 RepID=A0A211ZQ78_9PROT|nr:hypothetical protein [Inquilinus limosus]OWJ67432.1 hypothetical protein BWR60_09505 [Inquilinus limosus]